MPIKVSKDGKQFHLQAGNTSYAFAIMHDRWPAHAYWGKRVNNVNCDDLIRTTERGFCPTPHGIDGRAISLDTLSHEYPAFGNSDFRSPAIQVKTPDGARICDLVYQGYELVKGKPALDGLPCLHAEDSDNAETLLLTLKDTQIGLKVVLSYTVYAEKSAIIRSAALYNEGGEPITLLRAMSLSLDLPDKDFELVHLYGAHVKERQIAVTPLRYGTQSVESRRGMSSHAHNPFIALKRPHTNEDQGDVYACNLVYSGSFLALAEVDTYDVTRVQMGINPFDFSWEMQPNASFQTPEAVMVYSDSGLNGMSATFHDLYRNRLGHSPWLKKERPIVINNWEATYFSFDETSLKALCDSCTGLGIELFVLDDGWFGKRNDDLRSLGDWVVNQEKLPGGLKTVAENAKNAGLQFGLWFEPEMISPDSDLYRAHPDWAIQVPTRPHSLSRMQCVLDLSREEVRDYVVDSVCKILDSAPISYVKWDANRHLTEVCSAALPAHRQQELWHRYVLGLYDVLERITSRHPEVLFESCSGGGGRFDPGMLYYMPQVWASDCSDAIERLRIQYGTSLCYPVSSMSAHVSVSPNHQVHRQTDFDTRGLVALLCQFGYELNIGALTDEEREQVKQQTALYKQTRHLIADGTLYRLRNPFDGNDFAWMLVSPDKREAVVVYALVLSDPQPCFSRLTLRGLDPNLTYRETNGGTWGGDELMNTGFTLPFLFGDFKARLWHFKAE
ncbi:MAG: alpha-galactosidase [Oscillospiraceae bacterium]|nr:alpha-galactosidase [Oscillospiraceae bacterium]